MLNENAKKWVDALRSERYAQGRGQLCFNDEYCCLGVACEIYRQEHPAMLRKQTDDGILFDCGWTQALFYLPYEVKKWLGLNTDDGSFRDNTGRNLTLIKLNDRKNFTFQEIANLIESEPEGLFVKSQK